MYPQQFELLIDELHRLPGIGGKSAERMAFAILEWDEESQNELIKALEGLKKLHHCKVCGNLTDQEECSICNNENRDHKTICVVSNIKDLFALENLDQYQGVYHVLGGVINIQKGVLPEDLNIDSLLDRVDDQTKEVILALDPTTEGELTAEYLTRLLKNKVSVTRLASGLPMGGKLDYADNRTLLRALEGRTKS